MNSLQLSDQQLNHILSPAAIRERAERVLTLCQNGKTHFAFHDSRLQPTVDYVLKVIQKNYPDLKVPFHSRWGHFRAGGKNRVELLEQKIKGVDPIERCRIKLDLVVTSVLLDAGAGAEWKYFEESSREHYTRSEGLGLASFYMFLSGVMSSDRRSLRADREGLQKVSLQDLDSNFQVSSANPLVGREGRLALLNNLSGALENSKIFKEGRPGNLVDYLTQRYGQHLKAEHVLRAVLDGFGPIWPGRLSSGHVNLGDVWFYPGFGKDLSFETLVPIHKLSQWMTYSLIEPILEAGVRVDGVDRLTGLAEYRNGGLMLDSGLLTLRNSDHQKRAWRPDSDLIIEWRALTVALLDRIGQKVQEALKMSPEEFPLAKVLEGGTWWAGRFLAKEKRVNGEPPLNIESDGTVF